MKRYTHKSLCADLATLNARLEKAGHPYRLAEDHRNGYSAIDIATPEQAARHCGQRMLVGGTPKECLIAAQSYVLTST